MERDNMNSKIPVSAEITASKSYLMFERKMSPNKLRKLKPLLDKIKYDFRKEAYSCTADMIKAMCEIQPRLRFNMTLKALPDSFLFKFASGSEYMNAIIYYSQHVQGEHTIKTNFRNRESIITLMLLANNTKDDEVVATW